MNLLDVFFFKRNIFSLIISYDYLLQKKKYKLHDERLPSDDRIDLM